MDLFLHNFIADMYGPHFLGFYLIVIVTVLALGRWRVWSADRTWEDNREFPDEPVNPLEVALLRGEINEVLRLTVVELVQRGYLGVREQKLLGFTTGEKLAQSPTSPDPRLLSAIQRPVFDFFEQPRIASNLFSDSALRDCFQAQCAEAENRLVNHQLITPQDVRRKSFQTAFLAALVILGLGGYKLAVAIAKGKSNVGFLIFLGFLGTIAAVLVCQAPRVSRRGKLYLKKLQDRYYRLKSGLQGLTHAVDDTGLIFAVALFGLTVLKGTPYENLIATFRQANSSSGGCGGSGCGGGGCGGGGCGGG